MMGSGRGCASGKRQREFDPLRLAQQTREVLFGQRVGIELVATRDQGDQRIAKIVAAEQRIACRRPHLHDALELVQQGYVERASAQIENEKAPLLDRFQAMRQRGGGRFVDQALDLEPRQPRRVERRLALGIAEIGGDGNYGVADRAAGLVVGVLLQRAQHQRRQFLRAVELAGQTRASARSHPALERGDRAIGMRDEPIDRRAPDQHRSIVRDRNRRGRERVAERIGDQPRPLVGPSRNQRIGRPQINSRNRHARLGSEWRHGRFPRTFPISGSGCLLLAP